MSKEPKNWITVNGQHVPLFEGESKFDAIKRIINQNSDDKDKQIAKNKAEAEERSKTATETQQETTKQLPRQLHLPNVSSAKANSTSDVLNLETKQRFRFKDDTFITNVYVFAGKGCSKEFRDAQYYVDRYSKRFPKTGTAEDWQHCAGMAQITDGEHTYRREVHWVQGKDGKIREAFIKFHKKKGD